MKPLRVAVVVLTVLALGGCGGGGGSAEGETTTDDGSVTVAAPQWAVPALSKAGPEGAAIMAGSDWAVGENRVSFLLVRENGSVVRAPRADVSYTPDADGPPRTAVARLVSIGVDEPADSDEVREIYVVDLDLPKAEKTWIVIEPRGVAFQGFQILDVKAEPEAIAIGEEAPASDNPTLDDAPATRITTSRPPDLALLRYSVADSLAAGVPFVVTFATPAYCESRTCGPTVDVVEAVRKRFEREGVRFIHVEIYEDNQPGQGVNRWVTEWKLPTEPWVFVVDRKGIVRDRFEGAVSVGELTQAVRRNLLD